MPELVSFPLRHTLREYCVSYLSVRVLEDIFYGFGIEPVELDKREREVLSSSRRITVESFYKAFDWASIQDVQLFLQVLTHILDIPIQNVGYSIAESDEKQHHDQQRILDLCAKDSFHVDGKTVSFWGEGGVKGKVKNLIFASSGEKPEIILRDSVNNDIQIVKNEQYCLVYDQPIPERGLLWGDLIEWWRTQQGDKDLDKKALSVSLYRRLLASLHVPDSPGPLPEEIFFKTYMFEVAKEQGENFFALLPQVYLHYDPYTVKQRGNKDRPLKRQRMDFLLLFSNKQRVVIEIDGKQHYSVNNTAIPSLYAEMVREDRRLKLAGYEIYRFGGYEFVKEDEGKQAVRDFFSELFQKYP
jgi:hypothetical protein